MTVFHNTDTIILCGFDRLDLTANQAWAVTTFFHHAFDNFSQSAALPWGNLLKRSSMRKSPILSFWLSCGPLSLLLHIFLSHSHLTVYSLAFFFPSFFRFLHLLPMKSTLSAFVFFFPLHFIFDPPTLSSLLLHSYACFVPHPPGTKLSDLIENWPFTPVFSCRDCD